jgi:hypothetical protein
MTTTFDTAFLLQGWPELAAEHGRTATYNPLGVTGSSITVVHELDSVIPDYQPTGEVSVRLSTLVCSPADAPNPTERRDTFTIDGQVWSVVKVGRQRPMLELQLERHLQLAVGSGQRFVS